MLLAISKGMRAVKVCSNKIPQIQGCPLTHNQQYMQ